MFGWGAWQTGDGVINSDAWDRRTYKDIRSQAPALQDLEKETKKHLSTGPILLQDLWAGLFKACPEIREHIPPALKLNEKLIRQTMETDGWKDARETTRLDEWGAALGALAFGRQLLEILPEEVKKAAEEAAQRQAKAEELQKTAQEMLQTAEAAREGGDLEAAEKAEAQAQDLKVQADSAAQWAEKMGNKAAEGVAQRAVRLAAKKAASEVSEALEAAEAFGWGVSPGAGGKIDAKQAFEVSQRVARSDVLRRVARLAGRVSRIALHKRRTKIPKEPVEVVDVELGDDLSNVLPSELALLGHPVLKRDFYHRYAAGELLQYKTKGRERLGRGPIVCCVDTSGSMAGEKEVWAKAVALALLKVAAREQRAFAAVVFGSRSEIKTFEWPDPRKASPESILGFAEYAFQGGTDFERPLREALRIIDSSAFKKADIVFITDGYCTISDAFLREFAAKKAAKEVSCYAVVLPPGSTEGVAAFSDAWAFTDLKDDAAALDVAFEAA